MKINPSIPLIYGSSQTPHINLENDTNETWSLLYNTLVNNVIIYIDDSIPYRFYGDLNTTTTFKKTLTLLKTKKVFDKEVTIELINLKINFLVLKLPDNVNIKINNCTTNSLKIS